MPEAVPALRTWPARGLAFGAGAVAALGQAPLLWSPAIILGLAAAIWLWACAETVRGAAWIGWAFGAGHFAVALVWIVEPFLIEPDRHGWMAPFALIFLAGGLALFWALAFGVARWLALTGARAALALVGAYAAVELLRAYVFTGFPWAMLVHGLIEGRAAQSAAVIGPHGLTLGLVLLVAVPVLLRRPVGLILPLALVIWPLSPQGVAPAPDAPLIRLVQPNATQALKWDPEMARVFYQRQISFSAAGTAAGTATGDARPALVVWPETAIPVWLDDAGDLLAQIGSAAAAPVLLGIQRYAGEKIYNSAVLIGPDGAQRALYDKHHLVPFGEYVPFGNLMARFGIYGFAANDGQGFSAGPGPALIDLGPGLGRALPLICYEAVFPQDVNGAPERPNLLIALTNDAWFGEISGPYQHLVQARFRAIEQGLPMVRVANTGVSAMIDAEGRVTASVALNTAGWVDAPLPPARAITPYARFGDGPAAIVALLLLAGLIVTRRRLT